MRKRPSLAGFIAVQVLVVVAAAVSLSLGTGQASVESRRFLTGNKLIQPVEVPRERGILIAPLYDEPSIVSDEELADVLKQILPRFPRKHLKPNHVEHALRTWHIDATFQNPEVLSGEEMKEFLVDHGKFLASWDQETLPLLMDRPDGVAVRWGSNAYSSVHHDHWLACLTEAGIPRDEPIFTPTRSMTIKDAIEEAVRDFQLDERETEWTTLSFALWFPETHRWQNGEGRVMSFDLLAERLMRGDKRFGVCVGTHRVYSLMALIRLDETYHLLSPEMHTQVYAYLENVRDLITACQFEDGRWPPDWQRGAAALTDPGEDEPYRSVIATGHHLEWLAIAPQELHPPREMIEKAADWIIRTTLEKTPDEILGHYTFYSHVGNALSLWRHTRAADFWRTWQADHPGFDSTPSNATAEGPAEGPAEARRPTDL